MKRFLFPRLENSEPGTTSGAFHYLVQAKMAMLSKGFHRAEAILLDANQLEEAMGMYQVG